ncbi:hypothetical protein B0H11DRAFT_2194836 [Mycena galericulata]|nr:hypothetical protein B0H11DRAFT_2194836 [Mycena galericulata]
MDALSLERRKQILKLAQGERVALERIENTYTTCPVAAQIYVHGDSPHSSRIAAAPSGKAVAATDAEALEAACRDQRVAIRLAYSARPPWIIQQQHATQPRHHALQVTGSEGRDSVLLKSDLIAPRVRVCDPAGLHRWYLLLDHTGQCVARLPNAAGRGVYYRQPCDFEQSASDVDVREHGHAAMVSRSAIARPFSGPGNRVWNAHSTSSPVSLEPLSSWQILYEVVRLSFDIICGIVVDPQIAHVRAEFYCEGAVEFVNIGTISAGIPMRGARGGCVAGNTVMIVLAGCANEGSSGSVRDDAVVGL